jgi:hypothetical protein
MMPTNPGTKKWELSRSGFPGIANRGRADDARRSPLNWKRVVILAEVAEKREAGNDGTGNDGTGNDGPGARSAGRVAQQLFPGGRCEGHTAVRRTRKGPSKHPRALTSRCRRKPQKAQKAHPQAVKGT